MKQAILWMLLTACVATVHAQKPCPQDHRIFNFPEGARMNVITKKSFGRGPQFRFLIGITDKNKMVTELKKRTNWKDYKPDSIELEKLLRSIGFTNGLHDESLTADRLEYTHIPYSTIGNLGGKSKQRGIEYSYVIMLVKETTKGIKAWKITSPTGCFLYFFTKCGNAFYPKSDTCPPKDTCYEVTVKAYTDTLKITPPVVRKLRKITVCVYELCQGQPIEKAADKAAGKSKKKSLAEPPCKDTAFYEDVLATNVYNVWMDTATLKVTVCSDTTAYLKGSLRMNSTKLAYSNGQTDTIKIYREACDCPCTNKWEVGLDAGLAFTGVPNIPDTVNARASGARFTANAYIGYNVSPNFQVGLSVSTVTLSYRDNLIYPRPPGNYNFYNDVFLAKPAIPVQAFGKVMFGSPRWRTSFLLSAGYVFTPNSQIQNNNVLLTANPNTAGGFVGMLGAGVDYFFKHCRWAVGFNTKAAYFSLNGDTRNYKLFAFPTTLGIRYRW